MTYTLFEFVKEKEAELTSEILEKKSIIDDTAEKSLEKDQVTTFIIYHMNSIDNSVSLD